MVFLETKEFVLKEISKTEKIILCKMKAAMEIQEMEMYDEKSGIYEKKWNEIFFSLLEGKEMSNCLAYFITNLAFGCWNDLNDIFDEVFEMPKIKNKNNWRYRETNEYQEYLKIYQEKLNEIIKPILIEWANKKNLEEN